MASICQIGISLLLIGVILLSYQKVATIIDDYRFPPPGTRVDVGGYKLHIYSNGTGGPTVVLDAGLSGTSLGWSLVQQEVSKFTRVCSYDRAGYAWSDASGSKRTSYHLAEELHVLLHTEDIPGPYILVGHSFGGCNALMFADMYPTEVLGVILVDSVHEDMLQDVSQPPQGAFNKLINHPHFQWLLSAIGYKRIKGPSKEIAYMFAPLPEKIRSMYFAQMNKTGYTKTVSREMESLHESLCQLRERKVHLQDKPLIVITAGQFTGRDEEIAWNPLQKKLLEKSNRAKQVIAGKSDHMINHHQPQVIVEAIQEIWKEKSL
jgi:pimeloyl-ACP methyl ester carboxylesterase